MPRFQRWLLKEVMVSEEELDQVDASVEEEIVAAEEFAEASPFPAPPDLYRDVHLA